MLGIYKLSFDCGRMGELTGVFVESEDRVSALIESKIEVDFGEALGKHSQIRGPIDEGELQLITTDETFIGKFQEFELSTGYDPFDWEDVNGEQISEVIDLYIKDKIK